MRLITTAFLVLLCAIGSTAQEDDDERAPLVTEIVFQDTSSGSFDDIGVALEVSENFGLFGLALTEGAVADENAGDTDIVLYKLNPETLLEEEVFQFGGDGEDMVYQGSLAVNPVTTEVVVVGSTFSTSDNIFGVEQAPRAGDWFIGVFDSDDLQLQNFYINGTRFEEQGLSAVVVDSDGNYVCLGYTWGDQFDANAGTNNNGPIGFDIILFKIDSDLENILWGTQYGTPLYDDPVNMVIDSNDFVYVVGRSNDTELVLGPDDEEFPSIFINKVNSASGLVTRQAGFGTKADGAEVYGIALSDDERHIYVSGHTTEALFDWPEDRVTGSQEFFIASFQTQDLEFEEIYQSEGNGSVFATGGIVVADDGNPIVGGFAFGNFFNLSFDFWEFGQADFIAAKVDLRDAEILKYYVAPGVSNLTDERPFAMVRDPQVDDGVYMMGQSDGDFVDIEDPRADFDVLAVRVELVELPELEEIEVEGDPWPFDYWVVGVALVVFFGLMFVGCYKWAARSLAIKEEALKNPKV